MTITANNVQLIEQHTFSLDKKAAPLKSKKHHEIVISNRRGRDDLKKISKFVIEIFENRKELITPLFELKATQVISLYLSKFSFFSKKLQNPFVWNVEFHVTYPRVLKSDLSFDGFLGRQICVVPINKMTTNKQILDYLWTHLTVSVDYSQISGSHNLDNCKPDYFFSRLDSRLNEHPDHPYLDPQNPGTNTREESTLVPANAHALDQLFKSWIFSQTPITRSVQQEPDYTLNLLTFNNPAINAGADC